MIDAAIEEAAMVSDAELDGGEAKVTVRLEPGMVIPGSRYRIERWLGEGGVGVVFECSHVELERRAALKVLKGTLTPEAAKEFREEAIAAARAHLRGAGDHHRSRHSPHIVDVFDVGELPDGRVWIAMELLDGVSLASQLREERRPVAMPVSRSIGILRQVCKGLGTAHRAGLVHRDVKPPNVMLVSRDGKDDFVKLVDFGVATPPDKEESGSTVLVGTPPYMAPEQITGEGFDHHLDIYAVGCLAFRMMTGELPFRGATLFELFRAHQKDPAPVPSETNAQVPTAFDAVILKCLQKNPNDRYDNMDEVEAALCEAQLEAGITTAWDELTLPAVAPELQARLRAIQPTAPVTLPSSRWIWPAVAAAAVAVAAVVVWQGDAFHPAADSALATAADDVVSSLVDEARKSAAAAHWVYPDPVVPDEPTAYVHVLALEELEGDDAEAAASMLRSEFAHALNRLGDRYWEHADGKGFALDYYLQASLFDPTSTSSHVSMTPGERMLLEEKAAELGFTEADLHAAKPLVALAEPDDARREQKLLEVLEDDVQRPETTSAKLTSFLRPSTKARRSPVAAASARKAQPAVELEPEPKVRPRPETHVQPEAEPEVEPEADVAPPEKASPRRAAEVAAIVAQGRQALAVANRGKAEHLFNRALAIDSRSASALYGLGVVQFDRGDYDKASRTLGRAVAARPRDRQYRIKLGDAFFKNFQYNDARKHYAKADELGSTVAAARLRKVDEKLR